MPIYEYEAQDKEKGCGYCRDRFETFQKVSDEPLKDCPKCGMPVRKLISVPSVGSSVSGLDDRAKKAGFTKLKRIGKGEYEKQY